jgi:hypothetical protein
MHIHSDSKSKLHPSSAWRRIAAGFLTLPLATKILWGILFVSGLFLLEYFGDLKRPSETSWFKDIAANQRHSFKTFLSVGLWYGTLIHLLLISCLLGTVRWWGKGRPAKYSVTLGSSSRSYDKAFWILLIILCISAGMIRWPKMSLSYWGDEGWAVAPYVYGKHVPVDPAEPQGALVHKPVSWTNTAFDDRTCGNHYLFSLAQRATLTTWRWFKHLPPDAFDETISRLPPFAAGLASLIALSGMLRWLGRPIAGLAAATLMALHPWHLRYSTEARGYTMMLFFLIVCCWLGFIALRSGKWRWWLSFGLAEFLCMYSWKGVMYPLAAANLVLLMWIRWGKLSQKQILPTESRSGSAWRWLVANVIAAGLFINLVYPCLLQVKDAKEHLIQLSGRPMGRQWLDNSISGIFTGMPWHIEEKENPTEVVLSQQLKIRPLQTSAELVALASLLALGLIDLARRQPWLATINLSFYSSAIFGAWFFRYVIDAEWISWYFLFLIFPFSFLAGLGVDSLFQKARWFWNTRATSHAIRHRSYSLVAIVYAVLGFALPASFANLTHPASVLMCHQAYEDHRGAFQITRGRHEKLHDKSPSKVWTVYLWRYISLYDPRGDTHVRRADELNKLIAEVERQKGELYVIVGHRQLARSISTGIMNMVEHSGKFHPLQTFWAPEELHCLHCYKYQPQASLRATSQSEQ